MYSKVSAISSLVKTKIFSQYQTNSNFKNSLFVYHFFVLNTTIHVKIHVLEIICIATFLTVISMVTLNKLFLYSNFFLITWNITIFMYIQYYILGSMSNVSFFNVCCTILRYILLEKCTCWLMVGVV